MKKRKRLRRRRRKIEMTGGRGLRGARPYLRAPPWRVKDLRAVHSLPADEDLERHRESPPRLFV